MASAGKVKAAEAALSEVKDGMVLGIGTGSTVAVFIDLLGRRAAEEGLRLMGVPTSYQSAYLAAGAGIPLTTLDEHPVLDLAIDGADEVDRRLNLIKGGGAALTREKIVDSAAKRFVVIADGSKLVEALGARTALPIEVMPVARRTAMERIRLLGGEPRLRDGGGRKDGPCISDNGNFIVDAKFKAIADAAGLERSLKLIPGVVEVGLFVGMANTAYIGGERGAERLDR